MTVTAANFRENFPEFTSATLYPNALVDFWIAVADKRLDPNAARWEDLIDTGKQLYVAHNLVLQRQAAAAASKGAPPGANTGAVNAKAVGPVSIGYDSAVAAVEGAGNYNLTTYGTRFMELVNIVGAGGVQL